MYGFNWLQFVQQRGVEFVDRGPSVTKNHIAIKCPFCGTADPSHHMSLSLVNAYWRCWRNKEHSGRNPARLIMRLLNCSWHEASRIAGTDQLDVPQDVDLAALRGRLDGGSRQEERLKPVLWPEEFFTLAGEPRTTIKQRMLNYLEDRAFHRPVPFARRYGLRGAVTGEYAYRVIVPLARDGVLYGWTARAISKNTSIRYLTHGSVRDFLYEPPQVQDGGYTLLIVEGPFDALKVDCYGQEHQTRAVAMLGLDPSPGRLARLGELAARFRRVGIVLDRGAEAQALRLQAMLTAVVGKAARRILLPRGRKDPGELRRSEVATLCAASW